MNDKERPLDNDSIKLIKWVSAMLGEPVGNNDFSACCAVSESEETLSKLSSVAKIEIPLNHELRRIAALSCAKWHLADLAIEDAEDRESLVTALQDMSSAMTDTFDFLQAMIAYIEESKPSE